MPRCVALLRGINVGGRAAIAMADLRALFEDLGHADVQTYVRSGNVVFTPGGRVSPATARTIEERLARDLGVPARVVLRTAAELDDVVASNPYLERGVDPATLHVAFLEAAPDPDRASPIDPERVAPDQLSLRGREAYLYYPDGYGRTKLTNALLERKLGVTATTRNWRTVTALRDLASA